MGPNHTLWITGEEENQGSKVSAKAYEVVLMVAKRAFSSASTALVESCPEKLFMVVWNRDARPYLAASSGDLAWSGRLSYMHNDITWKGYHCVGTLPGEALAVGQTLW